MIKLSRDVYGQRNLEMCFRRKLISSSTRIRAATTTVWHSLPPEWYDMWIEKLLIKNILLTVFCQHFYFLKWTILKKIYNLRKHWINPTWRFFSVNLDLNFLQLGDFSSLCIFPVVRVDIRQFAFDSVVFCLQLVFYHFFKDSHQRFRVCIFIYDITCWT